MIVLVNDTRVIQRNKILLTVLAGLVVFGIFVIRSLTMTNRSQEGVTTEKAYDDPIRDIEYARRLQRLRDVCQRNTRTPERIRRAKVGEEVVCKPAKCPVVVDQERALLFCFIPKVAATQAKKLFLAISKNFHDPNLNYFAMHRLANKYLDRVSPSFYPPDAADRFYKVMFVRHPFERLVSAFRDKAKGRPETVAKYQERYWTHVMKRLRPEGSPLDNITFPEFVWLVLNTEQRDLNPHWTPYWSRCDPCLVHYDFIGKFETADRDYAYAFKKVGIYIANGWFTETTSSSVALKYFSALPRETILELYSLFKLDFDMFGYSVEEYLDGK